MNDMQSLSYKIKLDRLRTYIVKYSTTDHVSRDFDFASSYVAFGWRQQSETNTDRTIGLTFTSQNGFLEIFGTQIAH